MQRARALRRPARFILSIRTWIVCRKHRQPPRTHTPHHNINFPHLPRLPQHSVDSSAAVELKAAGYTAAELKATGILKLTPSRFRRLGCDWNFSGRRVDAICAIGTHGIQLLEISMYGSNGGTYAVSSQGILPICGSFRSRMRDGMLFFYNAVDTQ